MAHNKLQILTNLHVIDCNMNRNIRKVFRLAARVTEDCEATNTSRFASLERTQNIRGITAATKG